MQELKAVKDCTLLTQSCVYQIEGVLFKFRYQSDSINHPQFTFEPLAGQRKTAPLILNQEKVRRKVFEVPSLYRQIDASVSNEAVQLSLF